MGTQLVGNFFKIPWTLRMRGSLSSQPALTFRLMFYGNILTLQHAWGGMGTCPREFEFQQPQDLVPSRRQEAPRAARGATGVGG